MRISALTVVAMVPTLCSIARAVPTYNATCATANDCTYSFTGATGTGTGINLGASAEFVYNNDALTITVTNNGSDTSTSKYANADMLGAIFFGTNSLGAITEGTATAQETITAAGAQTIANGSFGKTTVNCASTTDISCGYTFDDSTTASGFQRSVTIGATTTTLKNGISSIGFGIFTPNSNFQPNAGGHIQGLDNGIPIAPSDLAGKANHGLGQPLVLHQASFVLNVGSNFDLKSAIGAVGFQYGTSLDEPYFLDTVTPGGDNPATPEPSFFGLVGLGLAGILLTARHRLRKQS